MLNSKHVIQTPEGDQLSFWSLVMDIQGGFIKGKKNKGKEGVRFLFKEGEDPYTETFGTSATLMHYGFGWVPKDKREKEKEYVEQQGYKSMKFGELANRYPYIAEAVINRGLKREEESFGSGPFKSYKHMKLDKESIKEKAQVRVKYFSGYTPEHWDVRTPDVNKPIGNVRKDLLL
jgi:hypothetical protein